MTLRGPEIERLLDQQRLVDEVGLWGDQGQRDPVARQITQCQQGLEPRHTAPDNEHTGPGVTLLFVHR